jgi:hypothetical protein
VRVAGARWTIEGCLEEATGEVGLADYAARRWDGWDRHVTLALLAHAVLVAMRAAAKGGDDPLTAGRVPPSVAEVRRLLLMAWPARDEVEQAFRLAWSRWRRRSHYRRRLGGHADR